MQRASPPPLPPAKRPRRSPSPAPSTASPTPPPAVETVPSSPAAPSLYLSAFHLALDTVLAAEAHLFSAAEHAVFAHWRALPHDAQYLYVRLFLRKTAAWHRVATLDYADVPDVAGAAEILQRARDVPVSAQEDSSAEAPADATLAPTFRFADAADTMDLDAAASLLHLDELKTLAKQLKLHGTTKPALLAALHRSSTHQPALHFTPPPRPRTTHLLSLIQRATGPCTRLSPPAHALFSRLHLVFHRTPAWSATSLTPIILAHAARRTYPAYTVSRDAHLFASRAALLDYEAAVRAQTRLDDLRARSPPDSHAVAALLDAVLPRWTALLAAEGAEAADVAAYQRRLSAAWVYTRIVHHGTLALGPLSQHAREHTLLTALLAQKPYHPSRRGAWYTRKAQLEQHHLHASAPYDAPHWQRAALRTCVAGLQDPRTHAVYHRALQARVARLERALRVPGRERRDFAHVRLAEAAERVVRGVRLAGAGRGGKTRWRDPEGGGEAVGVEGLCLAEYRARGWKGQHSERGILRTLFGLLLGGEMFLPVAGVFATAFQTGPLDLCTEGFFGARAGALDARLDDLAAGGGPEALAAAWDAWAPRRTAVVGVQWEAWGREELVEIVGAFAPRALAAVMRVLALEYAQRGGGVPDLFLWRPGEVMFAEVKSRNDRLSEAQRVWIDVLVGAGVRVEVCRAVAVEVREGG